MSIETITFDDGEKIDKETGWLETLVELYDYEQLDKQCKSDEHYNWGEGLNVLIMSDRCPGRTKGLSKYINEKTNIANVVCIGKMDDAATLAQYIHFDILIFIGYQKDRTNYEIKKFLTEINPSLYTIMYASLDDCIKRECIRNQIQYAFSSRKPARDFIGYIKESYKTHQGGFL
jgi:hypothetical protein